MLLKEEIDAQDFREIKRENERKIERLEARLIEVSSLSANIEPLLEEAVSNLAHLDELYQDGDTKRKRTINGSIYPQNLTLDGFQYRTTRINEAVELIYTLDAGFSQKETGQANEDFDLSCLVTRIGFKPMTPNLEGLCSIQLSYRADLFRPLSRQAAQRVGNAGGEAETAAKINENGEGTKRKWISGSRGIGVT